MRSILVGLCLAGMVACDRSATPPESSDTSATNLSEPTPTVEPTPAESTPTAPPPPPDSAFLALVPPEQTAQIRELGLPLVLPAAIPEGFQVAQVLPQQDERFAGYQILYRDGSNRCFLIEYTIGGIGGIPATENRLPLTPPILTDDTVEYGLHYGPYADSALREQFPEPFLVADWLPVAGGFTRLAGAALINATLTPEPLCTNIDVEEAVTIIDSLAIISDDIQGDGAPEE